MVGLIGLIFGGVAAFGLGWGTGRYFLSARSASAKARDEAEMIATSPFDLLRARPEMIFRLRKLFGNKGANFDCLTGRKTSLFSNFFGDLDYNNSWL